MFTQKARVLVMLFLFMILALNGILVMLIPLLAPLFIWGVLMLRLFLILIIVRQKGNLNLPQALLI